MSDNIKTIMNKVLKNRNEGDMIESYVIEDNIPGAKLTSTLNGYTMSELKWWLLCCSVKTLNTWNNSI